MAQGSAILKPKTLVVEDLISFLCCFSFSVQRGEKTLLAGKTQLPIN